MTVVWSIVHTIVIWLLLVRFLSSLNTVESSQNGSSISNIAMDDVGNVVVIWSGNQASSGGLDFDVFARRYLADGTPDAGKSTPLIQPMIWAGPFLQMQMET